MKSAKEVPNRVFVGCPWKIVKPKYEKVVDNLKKKYPLAFVLIGREREQTADDLLSVIKEKLLSSSHAIFDATNGNANVSLEFGFAEASRVPVTIYLGTHKAQKSTSDSAIISDLAGKRRKQYAQEKGLHTLLQSFAKDHPFVRRFENFMRKEFSRATKGKKKRSRTLALKIIHCLDWKDTVRRADLLNDLQANAVSYKEHEIEDVIKKLGKSGLIKVTTGRYADVYIN